MGPDPLARSSLATQERGPGDDVAKDVGRGAGWTDGLNMLRDDRLHVATEETEGFVYTLTEVSLKIKLLNLSRHRLRLVPGFTYGCPVL